MIFLRTLILIACVLFTCTVWAQESVSQDAQNQESNPSALSDQEPLKHDLIKQDAVTSGAIKKDDNQPKVINPPASGELVTEILPSVQSTPSISKPAQLNGSSIAVKVIFTLLGISLLIVGLAWLAKRIGVPGVASHHDMRVLASLSLGQREKAVLVEVLGKKMLLGTANGSVNKLHIFNDSDSNQASPEFSDDNKGDNFDGSLDQPNQHEKNVDNTNLDAQSHSETSDKRNFSSFLKKIIAPSVTPR